MGGEDGEDPDEVMAIKEGNEVMQFDWDMLQEFSERLLSLFDGFAKNDPKNPKNSHLDLKELRKMKNPDIVETMEQLYIMMNDLNYMPRLGKNKITKVDIKNIILKFENLKK